MAKIQSLLPQAQTIRDATVEGENSALRVGSLFVSLIQSILTTLPAEMINAAGITFGSTEAGFVISFHTIKNDGTAGSGQITIPHASAANPGLMTEEHVAALTKVIADVATAQDTADAAQSTAEGMAVTELKFFNMEDGHYGAIGLYQGGKPSGSVMIPHSTTERSGLMCRGQAIHLDELYKDMPGVKSSLTQAHSKADDALAAADGAQASADAAQSAANNALTQARAAVAKGLQLPRFSGTVIDGVPRGSSVLNQGAGFRSTSPGCAVVFDKSCDRFLLRVHEQGALFPKFYTLWVDAEQMGLTEDMDPELPRIFKALPGVAYMATDPPYGLWLLGVGQADLIEGTQPPVYEDFSEDVQNAIDSSLTTEKVMDGKGRTLEERLEADREQVESQLSNVFASDPETPSSFPGISTFSREQLKKDLFIDMWENRCRFGGAEHYFGKYNRETGFFELNEITDITYEEALQIWALSRHQQLAWFPNSNDAPYQYLFGGGGGPETTVYTKCRTYFPIFSGGGYSASNLKLLFAGNTKVETLNFVGGYGNSLGNGAILHSTFQDCNKLRKILCQIGLPRLDTNTFCDCQALEYLNLRVYIDNQTINLRWSPKLTYESLDLLVSQASFNSADTAHERTLAVTVHPDVYAKLTDESNTEWHALIAQGAAKNITFATV